MNRLYEYRPAAVLTVMTMILLVISYQLAFKNTLKAWQINSRLKEQTLQTGNLQVEPVFLKRKADNMKILFDRFYADSTQFRSVVINEVSILAQQNGARLTEIPGLDTSFTSRGIIVQELTLNGDFFSLLKIYDQLDRGIQHGLVRSVSIIKPTPRTGNIGSGLQMQIFISGLR